MSTYLQLCTKLRQLSSDSGTGPAAVTGQTGELARIVQWVADSYTDIQVEKDSWRWMRKSFTVSATSGDGAYAYTDCTDTVTATAIARWSRWYRDSIKCYLTSAGVGGEYALHWLPWEDFRRIYRYGTQTNAPPCHVSEDPTQALVLGPIPDATYTVSGDYQIGPQTLAADGDTPEMPAKFHMLIVYDALIRYGFNRAAAEALQLAQVEGSRLASALRREQLPQITLGRSLA
ncbi:MAG: hypothetical protein NUV34_06950 [Sulfuricaulis sp.]|nr:hypothetical protein [Sulfuricaulis sp.]